MLMHEPNDISALGDAAGFMLIETLVAMISAIVITGALFAILIVSLHQTARISGRVQATQLGRTTMTRMVDELHSACIAKEFTPIQAKSSETTLIFISGVGTLAVLGKAYERKISYSSTEGTLVEKTWADTGGEWPNFTFPNIESATPTTTRRIGEYISQSESGGKKLPIFQYYSYAPSSSSTNPETKLSTAVTTLNTTPLEDEAPAGLEKTNAEKAAAVQITYTSGASEGKQYKPSIEVSDQVTLAFTAPSAETPIVAKPCE
jgi:hypothetical protein